MGVFNGKHSHEARPFASLARLSPLVSGALLLVLTSFVSACAPSASNSSSAHNHQHQLELERLSATEESGTKVSLERPPSIPDLASGKVKPPEVEELPSVYAEAGERWFFGGGLGRTALNVGTVIVFPPYALYLLGNAGLALAGYEPVSVTDALPEEAAQPIDAAYNGLTSIPGRITSFAAGRDYASKPAEPALSKSACNDDCEHALLQ